MTTPIFTWSVTYASQMKMKPRALVAKMGDGYEQRVLDGINTELEVWQVTANSTDEVGWASPLEAFLRTQASVTPFRWTTKFGRTALFVCREWQRQPSAPGTTIITGTFEEVPA